MRWKLHVRFGERVGETDQQQTLTPLPGPTQPPVAFGCCPLTATGICHLTATCSRNVAGVGRWSRSSGADRILTGEGYTTRPYRALVGHSPGLCVRCVAPGATRRTRRPNLAFGLLDDRPGIGPWQGIASVLGSTDERLWSRFVSNMETNRDQSPRERPRTELQMFR